MDLSEASDSPSAEADTRFGFVSLLGAPNAGKSTLINQLVGQKVSIVTHKVQTTRSVVRAVFIEDRAQVVIVDTPGVFAARRRLENAMVTAAWSGAEESDHVALLIDARAGLRDEERLILERLATLRKPRTLVINKVDLVRPPALLALAAEANTGAEFDRTFMVSALTGDGVADLRAHLAASMPPGPWHYDEDHLMDLPMRSMAAEITREKLFLRLHDELPYAATVETESWTRLKNGSVRIEQVIFVERESQRRIVLGEKGRTIKAIGMDARKDIAEMVEAPAHLFLFVKVRPKWQQDPERYREMGLEKPSGDGVG
jgi:GTP-binding protein Era